MAVSTILSNFFGVFLAQYERLHVIGGLIFENASQI